MDKKSTVFSFAGFHLNCSKNPPVLSGSARAFGVKIRPSV